MPQLWHHIPGIYCQEPLWARALVEAGNFWNSGIYHSLLARHFRFTCLCTDQTWTWGSCPKPLSRTCRLNWFVLGHPQYPVSLTWLHLSLSWQLSRYANCWLIQARLCGSWCYEGQLDYIANGRGSEKRHHQPVTCILPCQYCKKLCSWTITELLENPMVPCDEDTITLGAIHILCSLVIVILQVKDKAYIGVQPLGLKWLMRWASKIDLPHVIHSYSLMLGGGRQERCWRSCSWLRVFASSRCWRGCLLVGWMRGRVSSRCWWWWCECSSWSL